MPKPTIKTLQAELAASKALASDNYENGAEWKKKAETLEARVKEATQQFHDLKRRLHDAETEVARLNGYVARVREDDTVREELVAVGDPDGAQRYVPKRKHEFLGNREPDCTDFRKGNGSPYYRDDHPKPKHWIEY